MGVGLIGMGETIGRNVIKQGIPLHIYDKDRMNTYKFYGKHNQKVKYYTDVKELMENVGGVKMMLMMQENEEVYLDDSDVYIDFTTRNHKNSIKKGKAMESKGVKYLGVGVSENALTLGGDVEGYEDTYKLFNGIGVNAYFGTDYGAGTFAAMVRKSVEQTMSQVVTELCRYYGSEIMSKLDEISDMKEDDESEMIRWCVEYATENLISVPMIRSSLEAKDYQMREKCVDPNSKEVTLIKSIIIFVYACAAWEGEILCDHYGVDYKLLSTTWNIRNIYREEMFVNRESAKMFVYLAMQEQSPCYTIANALHWYNLNTDILYNGLL